MFKQTEGAEVAASIELNGSSARFSGKRVLSALWLRMGGLLCLALISVLVKADEFYALSEADQALIEQQVMEHFPGATVGQVGPASPCYCAEGPSCLAMVEVIGLQADEPFAMELAKSDNGWTPGIAWSHDQQYLAYYMSYVITPALDSAAVDSAFEQKERQAWEALQASRPACGHSGELARRRVRLNDE